MAAMKSKQPMKAAASPGEGVMDAFVPVAFATMAVLNKIGAENDLSLTLMRVLGILWDRRPRMAELADYLGLEKQTMSGLIARAEERGLVARAPASGRSHTRPSPERSDDPDAPEDAVGRGCRSSGHGWPR